MYAPLVAAWLASVAPGCVAPTAESPDFKELAKIAVRLGMPLPPPEAPLVLAHTGSHSLLGGRSTSRDPGIYAPAFLLEERADRTAVVLCGTERQTVGRNRREPLWRAFSLQPGERRLGGHVVDFGDPAAFVCAVQLAARGDEATAKALWQKFAAADHWYDDAVFAVSPNVVENPRLLLASCLFEHWRTAVGKAPTGWRDAHSHMKALLAEFAALRTKEQTALCDDLAATLAAPAAAAGSTEALLLDWSRRPSDLRHLGLFHAPEDPADEPARAIVLRGFDAVPALIALLDDRRVSVHVVPAFMRSPARIARVGELARRLLQEATGRYPAGPEDEKAGPARWRAWWEGARAQGEESYLVGAVLQRDGARVTGVREGPARVLAHKFPARLPVLCEEFARAATPEAQPCYLVAALAAADLPKETRVRVLTEFARRGPLAHRRWYFQTLATLDGPACAAVVVPELERLPADAAGPYWTCPEAGFTHVVMQLEDAAAWRAYLRAARRGSVGLRMEMMGPMNYSYIGDKNLARRLAFLAAFLDDKEVRDMTSAPERFDGPCAGFTIPRIAVRDYVAMQAASVLGFDDTPDEFWEAGQWDRLREKVRRELAGRQLPKLD